MVNQKNKPKISECTEEPLLHLNLRVFFLVGIYIILFTSPFQRGLFFQPELLPVLVLAGISFIFCVFDMVLRRERPLLADPLDWSILALIGAYALSLIGAVHIRQAISELLKVAAYFMTYWMAYRAVKKEKDLNIMLVIIYLAGVGVAIIGLLSAAGIIDFPGAVGKGRIMSTFQYANTLAIYLAVINIIGLAFSVRTENLILKLLLAAGNMLSFIVIIGTQSRGGWMLYPLTAAGFIALIPYTFRWRALYHLLIYVGCGLITSKPFLTNVNTGLNNGVNTGAAIRALLIGTGAVLVFQFCYYLIGVYLNRDSVEDRTRSLVATGGAIYLILVCSVYFWYAAAALPVATGQMLGSDTIARARSISSADQSYQDRLEFSRDALRIVKDYPIIGAGGGGWNALYHSYASRLYWTTETHNYFFQTWVESGTIGFIVLLFIWGSLIRRMLHVYRRQPEDDDTNPALITFWAVGISILALGIHSTFDFDLSMAAVGFLLYALIGAIRGRSTNNDISKEHHDHKTIPATPVVMTLTAVLGTALALSVACPAWSFYQGGVAGAAGAQAIVNQDLPQAKAMYEQAIQKDPYTASYYADLAQVWVPDALKSNDLADYKKSMDYARKAAELEPYNTKVRATLVNVYSYLGQEEEMIKEAEALVKVNPLVADHYGILATALMKGVQNDIQNRDGAKARDRLNKIMALPDKLPEETDKPAYALDLAVGQATALLGEPDIGLTSLKEAARAPQTAQEAHLWMAAINTIYNTGPKIDPKAYNQKDLNQTLKGIQKTRTILEGGE